MKQLLGTNNFIKETFQNQRQLKKLKLKLKLFLFSDEDLAGDHLLAEAKFPLKKILPQMQKKFQVALERPDLKVIFKAKTNRFDCPFY